MNMSVLTLVVATGLLGSAILQVTSEASGESVPPPSSSTADSTNDSAETGADALGALSGSPVFLDAKGLSTVDEGENYISTLDNVIGARFTCAKLDHPQRVRLSLNGVPQKLEPAGDRAEGYQVRLSWLENGVTQYETRSVRSQSSSTTDPSYWFADGFSDKVPLNVCLTAERIGSLTTFAKWRDHAFGAGKDGNLIAKYFNAGDLAFGRRVVGGKVGNNTFVYVMNFDSLEEAVSWKPGDGYARMRAIVALEHSNGQLKFSIFNGGDDILARRAGLNIDRRGVKFLPNVCAVCHNNSFVPIDVSNQTFSNTAGARLEDQQGMIKQFNQLFVEPANDPTPVLTELIAGWYSGGRTSQKTDFVPPTWQNDAALYSAMVQPYCRSCHSTQVGSWIDDAQTMRNFPTYLADKMCSSNDVMPNALITHQRFFSSEAPRMFQRLTRANIHCLPPRIESMSMTPLQFDKMQNTPVNFSALASVDVPTQRFERQITSDSVDPLFCYNADDGRSETCRWTPWSTPSTTSTQMPYLYPFSGQVNPAQAYANMSPGRYSLLVRAVGATGKAGEAYRIPFTVTDSRIALQRFTMTPDRIDQRQSTTLGVSYSLGSSMPLRFERLIDNTATQLCYSDVGQVTPCRWTAWNAPVPTTGSSIYNYGFQTGVIPSVGYATWQPGVYRMVVRGITDGGVITAERAETFEIYRSPPAISDFTLSPSAFSKSQTQSIRAVYALTANAPLTAMQRKISKNGQCIDPASGQVSTRCWYDWTVLSSSSTAAPYQYGFEINLVPATAYANWAIGSYVMEMQGTAEGIQLNRSLNFSVNP